jgi:hypothetical protein
MSLETRKAIEIRLALSDMRAAINRWIEHGQIGDLAAAEWCGARYRQFAGLDDDKFFSVRDAYDAAEARIATGAAYLPHLEPLLVQP